MQDCSFWYCYDRATYLNLVQWSMLMQGLTVVSLQCLLPQLVFPYKASQGCCVHAPFWVCTASLYLWTPCTGHWSLKAWEEKSGPCSAKDCWHWGRRDQKSVSHKAEDFKAFWEQVKRSFTDCGTASLKGSPQGHWCPGGPCLQKVARVREQL